MKGRACGTYGRDQKCIHNFEIESMKGIPTYMKERHRFGGDLFNSSSSSSI
jgi:hypothetical protein